MELVYRVTHTRRCHVMYENRLPPRATSQSAFKRALVASYRPPAEGSDIVLVLILRRPELPPLELLVIESLVDGREALKQLE